MNERERLIELMEQATNGSCHVEDVTDYLLENGVVVPPCKVGDTVYEVTSTVANDMKESKVVAIVIAQDGTIGVKTDYSFPITREVGRMVHLTKEEAQRALRKEDKGRC